MTDNNNITTDYGDMSSVELVDLLHKRDEQVTNLTIANDNCRQAIVDRDVSVVNLKDKIRAVVDRFRSAIIEKTDVTIDDWDSLYEYFHEFENIADLEAPVRHYIFEFSTSTSKRYAVTVTDPSLDESDIEDMLIDSIDTYQRVDFMPSQLDGIDDIEDEDYSTDFDVDDVSLSSND